MNFPASLETMSLTELEAERERLQRQKGNLETSRQWRENELRQAQTLLQQARDTVQHLIEQIVTNLLPDLSAQTLIQLARIFPNERNLYAAPENELPEQLSFVKRIARFCRRFVINSEPLPLPALEQRRVLLRGLLWHLSDVPDQSRSYRDLFHPLLQKKQEFSLHENAVSRSEAEANQLEETLNHVLARLSACEKEIARRKNVRFSNEDSFPYQSPFNSGSNVPIIIHDATNFDSSFSDSAPAAPASDDFSFGGGGDAAGGGAGGGWENYS